MSIFVSLNIAIETWAHTQSVTNDFIALSRREHAVPGTPLAYVGGGNPRVEPCCQKLATVIDFEVLESFTSGVRQLSKIVPARWGTGIDGNQHPPLQCLFENGTEDSTLFLTGGMSPQSGNGNRG